MSSSFRLTFQHSFFRTSYDRPGWNHRYGTVRGIGIGAEFWRSLGSVVSSENCQKHEGGHVKLSFPFSRDQAWLQHRRNRRVFYVRTKFHLRTKLLFADFGVAFRSTPGWFVFLERTGRVLWATDGNASLARPRRDGISFP